MVDLRSFPAKLVLTYCPGNAFSNSQTPAAARFRLDRTSRLFPHSLYRWPATGAGKRCRGHCSARRIRGGGGRARGYGRGLAESADGSRSASPISGAAKFNRSCVVLRRCPTRLPRGVGAQLVTSISQMRIFSSRFVEKYFLQENCGADSTSRHNRVLSTVYLRTKCGLSWRRY